MAGFLKSYNFYSLLIGPLIGLIIWAIGTLISTIYFPHVSVEYGTVAYQQGKVLSIAIKNPTPRPITMSLGINGVNPKVLATSGLAEVIVQSEENRKSQVLQLSQIQSNSFELVLITDESNSDLGDVELLRANVPISITPLLREANWKIPYSDIFLMAIYIITNIAGAIYYDRRAAKLEKRADLLSDELNDTKSKIDEVKKYHGERCLR